MRTLRSDPIDDANHAPYGFASGGRWAVSRPRAMSPAALSQPESPKHEPLESPKPEAVSPEPARKPEAPRAGSPKP